MVDYNPFLIMCRCLIVVLLDFSRCLLISFSVRPGQVFRKPCFIDLRRIAVVDMKSAAWRYCASYALYVWVIMLFLTGSDCYVSRGNSHIPDILFIVPLIISCPFSWTYISCLYSVMVYPSSHKNPNDISGAVFIFEKM